MKRKDIKLIRKNGGIFFVQDGVEYNLYKMPKVGADELFYIEGNLNLSNMGLTKLPDLSDCQVNGSFDCSRNPLTSLRGCPMYVCGDFVCTHTNITTLKGMSNVEDSFEANIILSHNKLKNLHDMSESIDVLDAFIDVSHNELTDLRGVRRVGQIKYLNCSHNKLKSLSGINGSCQYAAIDCSHNNLSRLNPDWDDLLQTIEFSKKDGFYVYNGPDAENAGLGFMKIDNFNGNPCFEKYARFLLKLRGLDEFAQKASVGALSVLFLDKGLREKLGLFIEAEELKTANRELFDNKKTFARGKSAVKALHIAKSAQKKIKPGKDDREH